MLGSRHKGDMAHSQSWEGQGREAEGPVGIQLNRDFWKHCLCISISVGQPVP